jgi:hypothetical protein
LKTGSGGKQIQRNWLTKREFQMACEDANKIERERKTSNWWSDNIRICNCADDLLSLFQFCEFWNQLLQRLKTVENTTLCRSHNSSKRCDNLLLQNSNIINVSDLSYHTCDILLVPGAPVIEPLKVISRKKYNSLYTFEFSVGSPRR